MGVILTYKWGVILIFTSSRDDPPSEPPKNNLNDLQFKDATFKSASGRGWRRLLGLALAGSFPKMAAAAGFDRFRDSSWGPNCLKPEIGPKLIPQKLPKCFQRDVGVNPRIGVKPPKWMVKNNGKPL